MTLGSLFSGIGGFDLGFERAGFEIRWQVEIDDYANRVLAQHWPDVRRYRDVRTVHAGWPEHECALCLEPVDVVVGGFPCQDVSDSGKRAGLAGAQSGLWREMRRLVGVLRPRYVVVENVTGLLDLGMGTVLGEFSAMGYDAEWGTLSACAFGAPHTRERVFIVAYTDAGRRAASWPREMEDAPAIEPVARRQSRAATQGLADWTSEPAISRVVNGIPAVVDRGAGLGNAIVPAAAEWIAHRIAEAERLAA